MRSAPKARAEALGLAALISLSGCAHAAATGARPVASAAPPPGPAAARVTGSRLPRPVDPVTGRAATESAVKVYTAEELRQTGDPTTAGALRRLDPGAP